MHITAPIRSLTGLVINPGATASITRHDRKARTAALTVKLTDRAVDYLHVRVPATELKKLK